MIYASILAAGSADIKDKRRLPQPYALLGTKPIIIHTLEQFVFSPKIDRIIIVVNSDWLVYTKELIRKSISIHKEIFVINGGKNKNQSILLAAKYIAENWGVNDDDIILNHDAIRPFVSQRIIDENIAAVRKHAVANTAMPTVDTIAISENNSTVDSIPPKSKMYSEQTPQTFNLKTFLDAYHSISEDEFERENNTARFMLNMGHDVHLVLGDHSNIKIVTAYDLEVANVFLRRLNNDK